MKQATTEAIQVIQPPSLEREMSSPAGILTVFNEGKTTAAASVLLKEAGGRMPYLRLIKLLYLADRRSWGQWGRPITGDRYFSMKFGPVLSNTLNLIKAINPGTGTWVKAISKEGYDVVLVNKKLQPKSLSEAEIGVLKEAHALFKAHDQWQICDLTHGFSEWTNPGDSSIPISPENILAALGKKDEEIEEIRQEATESAYFDELFSSR